MTSQQFLVCDASTLANFKSWGLAISSFFTTAGWVQATDTGQVNWSAIAIVPGANVYVYEIWKPGDALTTFFLKVEYGNVGTANSPTFRVSLATSTNGAGTLTGFFTTLFAIHQSNYTTPSTTTTFECDFVGTSSKIGFLMWRNTPTGQGQQFFGVQRSLDSSGAETSEYVTLWTSGNGQGALVQQSIVFGVGVPPGICVGFFNPTGNNWIRSVPMSSWVQGTLGGTTTAFNNKIPVALAQPMIGNWGNACTLVGSAFGNDITEGVTFATTVYGVTKTYMPTKVGAFANVNGYIATASLFCMEFD